jgi:amino acid transporter
MKKFWKFIINISDDVLAYILSVSGVFFSSSYSSWKAKEEITLDFSFSVIALSLFIALLVTFWLEALKKDENGSKEKSREGRRKKFFFRMASAMLYGIAAPQIIDKAISILTL